MLNRLAVFARKMERHLYALVQRTDGGGLLDQHIHLILDDLAQQGGDILVVVVEGVAVDPAVLHDAAHADLAQRLLVQQLEKRVFDCLLGKVRHRWALLSAVPPGRTFLSSLRIHYSTKARRVSRIFCASGRGTAPAF